MKFPAYTAYGARAALSGFTLVGYNGERYDPLTGCYHLGLGYRMYSPGLMRFLSPDSLSPFGQGGLHAFGYCKNDPVNHVDPTGHMRTPSPAKSRPLQMLSRRSPPRWTASPDRAPSSRLPSVSSVTTEHVMSGYNGQEIDFPLDSLNVSPSRTVPALSSHQQVTGNLNASPPISWPAFFQSKGFSSHAQISNESHRLASSISFSHVVGDPRDYRAKVAIYMYSAGSSVEPNSALRFVYPGITPFQLSEIALYAEEIRLPANLRF